MSAYALPQFFPVAFPEATKPLHLVVGDIDDDDECKSSTDASPIQPCLSVTTGRVDPQVLIDSIVRPESKGRKRPYRRSRSLDDDDDGTATLEDALLFELHYNNNNERTTKSLAQVVAWQQRHALSPVPRLLSTPAPGFGGWACLVEAHVPVLDGWMRHLPITQDLWKDLRDGPSSSSMLLLGHASAPSQLWAIPESSEE